MIETELFALSAAERDSGIVLGMMLMNTFGREHLHFVSQILFVEYLLFNFFSMFDRYGSGHHKPQLGSLDLR